MTSPAGYYIVETVRPIQIYRGFRKSRYNHEVCGYHIVFMHPFHPFPPRDLPKVYTCLTDRLPNSADHRRGHRTSSTTLTPEITIKHNTVPPPPPRARSFCAGVESPEWRKNVGMHDWGSNNKSEPPHQRKKSKTSGKVWCSELSNKPGSRGALALEAAQQAHGTPGRNVLACERCSELLYSKAEKAAFMQRALQSKNTGCSCSITTHTKCVRKSAGRAAGASLFSLFLACDGRLTHREGMKADTSPA